MRLFVPLILFFVRLAQSDTEILKFTVSERSTRQYSPIQLWPILDSVTPERRFSIEPAPVNTRFKDVCKGVVDHTPCPSELWVILNTTDTSHDRYTLRISWPASEPTDFEMKVISPSDLPSYLPWTKMLSSENASRIDYVRIRAIDTGILTPDSSRSIRDENENEFGTAQKTVSFNLILEPLHFGVLPTSVVPALALIASLLVLACLALPSVFAFYEGVAAQVRDELGRKGIRTD